MKECDDELSASKRGDEGWTAGAVTRKEGQGGGKSIELYPTNQPTRYG